MFLYTHKMEIVIILANHLTHIVSAVTIYVIVKSTPLQKPMYALLACNAVHDVLKYTVLKHNNNKEPSHLKKWIKTCLEDLDMMVDIIFKLYFAHIYYHQPATTNLGLLGLALLSLPANLPLLLHFVGDHMIRIPIPFVSAYEPAFVIFNPICRYMMYFNIAIVSHFFIH